jgi:hypothetical protein
MGAITIMMTMTMVMGLLEVGHDQVVVEIIKGALQTHQITGQTIRQTHPTTEGT